jgi:predicted RNA binding protein YcfA (HicA-like mRNA interferase family)
MPGLPQVTGIQVVIALQGLGFVHVRTRGSHYILRHPDGRGVTVPVHGSSPVAKGTLRNIMHATGLTVDDL